MRAFCEDRDLKVLKVAYLRKKYAAMERMTTQEENDNKMLNGVCVTDADLRNMDEDIVNYLETIPRKLESHFFHS